MYLCGPLPTPGIAYLTRALRLSAGIVISASHNPFDDNGIKFFSAAGAKLPDDVELAIERAHGRAAGVRVVGGARQGAPRRRRGGRYVEFCKSTFPTELDLHGMRIVVDCAQRRRLSRRAAGVPRARRRRDRGRRRARRRQHQRGHGATHPQFLAEQVRAHKADLGIALDGDGDRLVMADSDGTLYDGDQLLYVIATDYQRRDALATAASSARR